MGSVTKDRIRAKLKAGGTTIKVLLAHPMQTGRAKNEAEELIPAEFIQDIRCLRNGQEVLTVKCGTATAANPYFSFGLTDGEIGDSIEITWVDNLGKKGKAKASVT